MDSTCHSRQRAA